MKTKLVKESLDYLNEEGFYQTDIVDLVKNMGIKDPAEFFKATWSKFDWWKKNDLVRYIAHMVESLPLEQQEEWWESMVTDYFENKP